jgi:hypothetical protein
MRQIAPDLHFGNINERTEGPEKTTHESGIASSNILSAVSVFA